MIIKKLTITITKMILITGISLFPAEHYAGLWIKEGRHSATDNPLSKWSCSQENGAGTSSQAVLE